MNENRRNIIRWTAAIAFLAAASLTAGCSADTSPSSSGGDESNSPLVIGPRDLSTYAAPIYWAAAQGYFEDAGLDVSFKVGGAAHTAQFVAGQVDLYYGSQGGAFGIIDSGKQVQAIYGEDAGAFGYIVTPTDSSVQKPTDCTTVTTATPGTVVYAWTRQLESIYKRQWELTQLTSSPALAANIAASRTDCAVGNVNWYQSAIDEGKVRVVFDPSDADALPVGWPTLGVEDVISGLPDTLSGKRPAIEGFLKAYDKSIKDFMTTDSTQIAQTLNAYDSGWAAFGSVDTLAATIDDFKPFVAPNDGYISEETWANTNAFFQSGGLDFLGNEPSRFDYSAAVDMSYYDAAIGKK